MPKVRRSSSLSLDRSRASPYPCTSEDAEQYKLNSPLESTENTKEWEDTRCPICMEHPHNAVLIKCSSHEMGCRPYMCNTSYRHSNCLDQFCKSSVPESTTMMLQELPLTHTASHGSREEESLPGQTSPCGSQLQPHPACPLCRGKIYGYIVVEAARHFMNCKVRSCSSETCDFNGTYSELRKHARSEHPYVRPSEVDPNRHRDWMRLERQRDLQDVLSIVQVGSGDDIIPDPSTDGGWMTSLLSAMFRSFEIMIFSQLMESSSDMEQTHSRRSGRMTRVQQDNDTIPATRRNNTVSDSTSRPRGLRWRAPNNNVETARTSRLSHNSLSGETSHTSRWSNNSLEEASRAPRWGNSLSEEGTNRVLRRGNNSVSETTRPSRWGNNSVPEESNRVHRWGNNSVSESNRVHRWGNNSLSEESRWGNNSLSEEAGHAPRWGNTSVPESTPRPRRLRWRNQWPTYNNRSSNI
ncbi:uncharacterized protein LOC133725139 [Rosa rugosa]|uniref:uncharacterized protein LOC133725139 n=1 Tax=Rosa rugosa TaxID=74645 RepID=UPI002B403B18|nr:uncharacterized protein LOC133725139 [Rosa rugosa]